LEKEGAIIIGKSNLDQFGMGSLGKYGMNGYIRNPIDSNYTAGGSSSGSAASVRAL